MSLSQRPVTERHRAPAVSPHPQAVLIAAPSPETSDGDVQRSLAEIEQLLLGLGIAVVATVVQKRSGRALPTYLGEGKLQEVAKLTGGPGKVPRGPDIGRHARADSTQGLIVVADDELSPGQLRHLRAALGVDVLDRTAVILRVFESRARTKEAKLEIELARLTYELPLIREDHSLGDREGGGGRASRGHTNVELAKQRMRDRIAAVRRELDALAPGERHQPAADAAARQVALIGYTNAGKSSLMRQLTGSDVLVEDKLFATLGTMVRPLSPPTVPPVTVADTVGFIHRLPHALVASFRSTLAEARQAGLLLHVVDVSDPAFRTHMRVTTQVLGEIGAAETPTLLVLNKADRLSAEERAAVAAEFPDGLLVDARNARDSAMLHARIARFFARDLLERTFTVPYSAQGILAAYRSRLQVVREEYGEQLVITVRGTPPDLEQLSSRFRGASG